MPTDNSYFSIEVLHDDQTFTLSELCEICRLERVQVKEMIEFEIIAVELDDNLLFSHQQLARLLKASRLLRDLELNIAGAALALELLDTIDELQNQVRLHQT